MDAEQAPIYPGFHNDLREDPLFQDSSSSPSQPRAPSNALSAKVTAMLSTSYTDPEFRNALIYFDERNIKDTPEARRRLPLQLMKEVLDEQGAIIRNAGRLVDNLRCVDRIMDDLKSEHSKLKSQVTDSREAAGRTLTEAEAMLNRKREIMEQRKREMVFQERYVLTEDDVATLALASAPIDDHFFDTIMKCKRIIKECEVLLGHENQTVGSDLIEKTIKHLNLAYEKLYRWTQREFKRLNLENPQMGAAIRKALRSLAERPSLFDSCLVHFSQARERILSDSFFLALTGTLSTGALDHSVKPIDMIAHDPLRYAGDMLAWVHSAVVSEREALEALFVSDGDEIARGLQTGRRNELWHLAAEDGEAESEFDARKELDSLVDKDMAGVARLLRQRLEQVIQFNEEVVSAYKLINLLEFYASTFRKLLGDVSSMVDSVLAAVTEAFRQFRSLMREQISILQSGLQQIPANLHPPTFLLNALSQLVAIMKSYDASISASEDREAEFRPILEEALEPFISGCQNMVASLNGPNSSVFLINCLQAARATLVSFDFTRAHVRKFETIIAREAQALSSTQYMFFRAGSGLDEILDTLEKLPSGGDTRDVTPQSSVLDEHSLRHSSQILDNFLPSALMDAMENLRELEDSKLAREITTAAADRFCDDFDRIEQWLDLADEQQNDPGDMEQHSIREFFPRTTGDIRVLLS